MIQSSLRGALPCRTSTAVLQRSGVPIGRALPLGTGQAFGRAGVERRLQSVEGGARIGGLVYTSDAADERSSVDS